MTQRFVHKEKGAERTCIIHEACPSAGNPHEDIKRKKGSD